VASAEYREHDESADCRHNQRTEAAKLIEKEREHPLTTCVDTGMVCFKRGGSPIRQTLNVQRSTLNVQWQKGRRTKNYCVKLRHAAQEVG
jgi:hypothetical protein